MNSFGCGFQVCANLPFYWSEDPEVVAFFAKFFPAARPITRSVLTNRLIPSELSAQRVLMLPRIEHGEATLQCDGWSGGNFHHYTGFTMTVKDEVRHHISSIYPYIVHSICYRWSLLAW